MEVWGVAEGGEEEGEAEGLHGRYALHAGCGLSYKHQLGVCDVCVTHVEIWGAAEGVEEGGEAMVCARRMRAARGLTRVIEASVRATICSWNAGGVVGVG